MLEQLIEVTKDRWRKGAADFRKLVASRDQLPSRKTIRSAVYGNMTFEPREMRLIESFYLQRLRHVSQMGLLNLVYPDARHSRFEHSLGVLWSLKSLLHNDPEVSKELSDGEKHTLYYAALLHDCGHGPFSHTTESLLEVSGLDKQLRRVTDGEDKKVKPHERRCRDMIRNSDFHLANLGIDSYGLSEVLESFEVEPADVVRIVLGLKPAPLLNLVSGDFDVDKMDYFRRDALFTGTLGGGVDMEAMQRWVRIVRQDGGFPIAAYDSRIVGHLLHLLFSREHVYNVTAYHPVARVAAALLMIAGDLALRAFTPEMAALVFCNIELLDDREFLAVLEAGVRDVENEDAELLRRVVQRLYLRRLPKRLATLSRVEFIENFGAAIPGLQSESKTNDLPAMAYCRISEIADGRYLKWVAGGENGDEIAILDMTPQLGGASAGPQFCEKEKDTLSGIKVTRNKVSDPLPLNEWLDMNAGSGAGDAHAQSLRAYKLALWRALVLVPASLKQQLIARGEADQFQRDLAAALAREGTRRPLGKTRTAWAGAQNLVGSKVQVWRDELHASQQSAREGGV